MLYTQLKIIFLVIMSPITVILCHSNHILITIRLEKAKLCQLMVHVFYTLVKIRGLPV